jgi:endonuclease/exonuclease/phosphatase family metal-dependent hydrolase
MPNSAGAAVLAAVLIASSSTKPQPPFPTDRFKVASWNIRSGMGIHGFDTTTWTSDTTNCRDRSKPVNAWGVGLPQKALRELERDPSVVALALQEAWRCGSPGNVNAVLRFKTPSREQEGVALIARHGFADTIDYVQIDSAHNRWIVGGDVCLDAACSRSVPIFSTHWGGATDDHFAIQARATLEFLERLTAPHVFMGDLNVFKIDQWNPPVPCTGRVHPGGLKALSLIEAAGYRDAWKATQGGEGFTGMASRRNCGSPAGGLYKRIDYVFAKAIKVLATARFARSQAGTDSPSDHIGLIAELSSANP